MAETNFRSFAIPIAILILGILSFLVIKPIITPVVLGLVLAYLFSPVYKILREKVKSETISALILVILALILILIPLILIMQLSIGQVSDVYLSIRDFEITTGIEKIAPSLLESKEIATEIIAASSYLRASLSEFMLSLFKNTILNIPSISLGILILLFTFFFALKESGNFQEYFSILFPFPKQYEKRFFDSFGKITGSFLYGQFIVGIFQGIIAGMGYFILGVPNALLLTVITTIVGIIPVIGPWLVWIPVDIILFISGKTDLAIALLIYGLFVINLIDSLLRSAVVSNKAEINPAIALIGVIGGLYAFGVIGLILGPLILAYLIILIEIYKDKKTESVVLKQNIP